MQNDSTGVEKDQETEPDQGHCFQRHRQNRLEPEDTLGLRMDPTFSMRLATRTSTVLEQGIMA